MKPTLVVAISAALIATAGPAFGQLTVTVGDIPLQAEQSGQNVDLFIENTGGTAVTDITGLNFALQVDAGTTGPKVTGVNLAAGDSIFASYAANQIDQGSSDWIAFYGIDTSGVGLSLAPGSSTLLARVTFDTTGISAGSGPWPLSISDVGPIHSATEYVLLGGATRSIDSIVDGTLTAVPEPKQYASVCGVGLLAFVIARQLKRQRAAALIGTASSSRSPV